MTGATGAAGGGAAARAVAGALDGAELETVRRVPFLAPLDDDTCRELAALGRRVAYRAGERIVTELESGADVYVLLHGTVEVSIEARGAQRELLGRMGPGDAFGEMASLTGELRSATVQAVEGVEALVIPDAAFDDLRARRPEVAVVLVRMLAERLAGAERAIDELLAAPRDVDAVASTAHINATRGSVGRAWRELVVGRGKDLPFLTLAAFVATLAAVRALVYASFRFDLAPFAILRGAYVTGFALLGVSAASSLLTFRPGWRRAIAIAYGVAVALILNELGVTLAFDIFYKDIHTRDASVHFDVELLYRRTEALRGVVIAFAVLVQTAYLRPFWRRAAFVLRTRARKMLTSSAARR